MCLAGEGSPTTRVKEEKLSMDILYIHQHFRAPQQGGGGRPYEFAKRLVSAGHNVTLLAAGHENRRYQVDGIHVVQLANQYDNKMSINRRLLSFAAFMVKSSRAALASKPDLVFASSTPLTVGVPAMLTSVVWRRPLVFEVRDLWPTVPIAMGLLPRWLHRPAKLLERIIYRRAATVIALSPWMQEGVQRCAPDTPTQMIPNCSDVMDPDPARRQELREEFGFSPDEIVFYYAGSLGMSYDPEWIGHFALRASRLGYRVVIAGAGAGEDKIGSILESAGVSPSSVMLGLLSRKRSLELAMASDIALSSLAPVPELEHNSLNKVFDAFALGRPLIFNHGGWLASLAIEHGAARRLPRGLDDVETTDVLRQVTEKAFRESAAQQSHDLGRHQFHRDMLFVKFENTLLDAARNGRLPRVITRVPRATDPLP